MPLNTRLFGFLVSYQTNEVNRLPPCGISMTQMIVLSMDLSPKMKLAAILFVSALSVVFLLKSLPLLLLWICAALVKLLHLRRWSLFFLMLTATAPPVRWGIGAPVYALFAIILAVYGHP